MIPIFKYPIYCNTEINDAPRKYPNYSIVPTDNSKPVHQTVELKYLQQVKTTLIYDNIFPETKKTLFWS